jgi:hypothetical protein
MKCAVPFLLCVVAISALAASAQDRVTEEINADTKRLEKQNDKGIPLLFLVSFNSGIPDKRGGALEGFGPFITEDWGFVWDIRLASAGARFGFGIMPFGMYPFLEIKTSVLRTLGDPREASPHSTYIGGEIGISFLLIDKITLGMMNRVGAGSTNYSQILTWNIALRIPLFNPFGGLSALP